MTSTDYLLAETNLSQLGVGAGLGLRRVLLMDNHHRPVRWIAGVSYATCAVVSVAIWTGIFRLIAHLA